jgi:hypothetical protein
MIVGCDSKTETPAGAPASTPQATEKAADDMKAKTEDASERAKDAAANVSGDAKKSAEQASDALKKNADAAAESVNASPAAADAQSKLTQVMDAIRDKKWDIAETTLKGLETNKASLPSALQSQVENARKMLTAAKAGAGTTLPAGLPSGLPK